MSWYDKWEILVVKLSEASGLNSVRFNYTTPNHSDQLRMNVKSVSDPRIHLEWKLNSVRMISHKSENNFHSIWIHGMTRAHSARFRAIPSSVQLILHGSEWKIPFLINRWYEPNSFRKILCHSALSPNYLASNGI